MNIAIFEPSGRTGQYLISRSLEKGYDVSAFAFWFFGRYLIKLFASMKKQHEVIEQSDLEWIIVP